ncbi:uncharacterized protein [Eucyclogobius newberryi]|uniref:uncharacterized protein isoform X2 n=1 Tax=Eucyclogobius newberryi TaxID=166745 RepID=UPI003B5C66B0
MASASSKKNPGVLDHIGKIFGGDKKKKSKGSFRGALSPAPQKSSASAQKKKGADNAVVTFFRSIWTALATKIGLGDQKSQPKAKKAAAGDGKGSLTRIFKMVKHTQSPGAGARLHPNAEASPTCVCVCVCACQRGRRNRPNAKTATEKKRSKNVITVLCTHNLLPRDNLLTLFRFLAGG